MFQKKVTEQIKTHILFLTLFFFENRALNEITCKNIAQPDRPQMTIWRMCMACWIPKATNAHSEYVIFTAFPMEQWLDMNVRQFYVVHTLPACIIQFVPLATERGISLIILPCSIN